MNVTEIIKKRRSTRNFLDRDINYKLINKIIDAGRWAPSSCNRQTVKYLVIKNRKSRDFLAEHHPFSYPFSKQANVHILVLVDIRGYSLPHTAPFCYLDSAAAIQNMLLMATDLKLGSCWTNFLISEKGVQMNALLCLIISTAEVSG